MYKYIPVIKSNISKRVLVDFCKNRGLSSSFVPLLEVGHTKSDTDGTGISELLENFEKVFVDYVYFRYQKDKNTWDIDYKQDVVGYIKNFSKQLNLEGEQARMFKKKPIPVISETFQEDTDTFGKFNNVYVKGKGEGFSEMAIRISFDENLAIDASILPFISKMRDKDYVIIDSRRSSLIGEGRVTEYDSALTDVINKIRTTNETVNLVLLNSRFKVRTDNGEEADHLHWPLLADKFKLFGYGDYLTETESGVGRYSSDFSINYYDYEARLFLKFQSSNGEKEVLEKIKKNERVVKQISNHQSYCRYCRKIKDALDRGEGDDEFKKRRGELVREHQLNSISVNEMNSPHPSSVGK